MSGSGRSLKGRLAQPQRAHWRALPYTVACLAGWLVVGCAAPPRASLPQAYRMPLPAAAGVLTHTVAAGETLWSIGKRYGISHADLMRANGLTDATALSAGQVLVIPRPYVPTPTIPLYANPQWTYIVIHHSATTRGNARTLDRIHRKRGFTNGLGYHFVIDNGTVGRRDGQIEVGRRWTRQQKGAHCDAGGMNDHGIGICLVGDFTNRPPSLAQMRSLLALVTSLRRYYRIPTNRVIRHRDVLGKHTACPGDRFPWTQFKRQLAAPSS